jgi:hypothetical protein
LAAAYGVALYGLLRKFHFEVHQEFWERLMDWVHLPLMALLAVLTDRSPLVQRCLPSRWPRMARLAAVGGCIALFAGVVEIVQPHFHRNGSWSDFWHGVLGAGLGLALWESFRRRTRSLWGVAVAASLLANGWLLRPVWQEGRAMVWQWWRFPLLADFESTAALPAWKPLDGATLRRAPSPGEAGRWSLEIGFRGGRLPGAEFLPGELDFRPYPQLELCAFNPGPPLHLVVRIDDHGSHRVVAERAEWTLNLPAGHARVAIPLRAVAPGRRMPEWSAIRRIVFFIEQEPGQEARLFLDSIRLTD